MKIGVLTFFNYCNYGAALQSYGLYKTLEKQGHEVEYIDYTCPYIGNPFKLVHLKNKGLWGYVYSVVGYICYLPRRKKFKQFHNLIPHTMPVNNQTVKSLDGVFDKYITGSDQVWSLKLTNCDKTYFLDFVSDGTKKYSYAASVGENVFSEEQRKAYRKLLQDFSAISVREESGQIMVKEVADREAEITLDPTLLLSKEEWEQLCGKNKVKGKYLLVYQLGFSKQLISAVKKVAALTGLKVVYIPFPLGGFIKSKLSVSIGPQEWLTLFSNAEYVISDSFHGIIFSILFNKKFLAVVDGQHKNKRAISLLNKLGLQSRIATDDNAENIEETIDYANVKAVIADEVEKSVDWLKKNI